MRTPKDIAGFALPVIVLIIAVVVIVARNMGVAISQLEFYLACGFGSVAVVVLLLSVMLAPPRNGGDS